MDSNVGTTRRHLLALSTIGLTSLAGCPDDSPNVDEGYIEDRSTPVETRHPNKPPEHAPATFDALATKYTHKDLILHRGNPTDLKEMRSNTGCPDNRVFRIEVPDGNTAHVTIERVTVYRDIDLTLHVRDGNGDFQTVTQILAASPTDAFETRTLEFDISQISLPRNVGSICELTGLDTHEHAVAPRLYKRHQFIGVEHNTGVEWVNSEHLNPTIYHDDSIPDRNAIRVRGVRVNGNRRGRNVTPAGAIEYFDGDDHRTLIYVTRLNSNHELFGVTAHIDHVPAERWATGDYKYRYQYGSVYECRFATDISHFRELAERTSETLTQMGLTTPLERFEALGDFIQMLPYTPEAQDSPATVVLYESRGDCSSKSKLLSCILQNEPWAIMPAYIRCTVQGVNHLTIALSEHDLGPDADTDSYYMVSDVAEHVEDSFPDAEYAFFDMTFDTTIGEPTKGLNRDEPIYLYSEGDFRDRPSRSSEIPPTY